MAQVAPRSVNTSEARDLLFPRPIAIFLSSPKKSLRQIPNSRYNHRVDSYAKAPHRRLFHFPDPSSFDQSASNARRPVQKLPILNDLRTLKISPAASHSFSSTSALFKKHRGVYPKLPISEPPIAAIVSQIAGLFARSWQLVVRPSPCNSSRWPQSPPRRRIARDRRHSIFTCNKKAISRTLGPFDRNATTANAVYTSIPLHQSSGD